MSGLGGFSDDPSGLGDSPGGPLGKAVAIMIVVFLVVLVSVVGKTLGWW